MKNYTGIVLSSKNKDTVSVEVNTFRKHPKYKKRVKSSKKYLVHTEKKLKIGDKVVFQDTRPISRRKKWKITKII